MKTIVSASKYGGVREQVQTSGRSSETPQVPPSPGSFGATSPGPRAKPAARPAVRTPQILVPTLDRGNGKMFQEWFWRELREGGRLHRYLAREKAQSPARLRAVARKMHGVQRNLKGDFELKACVPAREFFRWRATDLDFWADDNNLRSYRRDNPDAVVFA